MNDDTTFHHYYEQLLQEERKRFQEGIDAGLIPDPATMSPSEQRIWYDELLAIGYEKGHPIGPLGVPAVAIDDFSEAWMRAKVRLDEMRAKVSGIDLNALGAEKERRYWTQVVAQAEASGNVRDYLESRDLSRSTYYKKKKQYGL